VTLSCQPQQDYSGTKQSKTTWHNVNFFSKLSDIAKKYIHVGDLIYVRGEINNKKIENGERAGQYMYSVTAIEVKFFPSRQKKENMNSSSSEEEFDVTEEEIPF
jgi:single-stranded DNA-binding protein